MTTYTEFLPALAEDVPALQPLVEEHLEDNEGEVEPHLLMSDIRRWCLETVDEDPTAVRRVVAGLARAVESGDGEIENAVAVSFVEDLMADGAEGQAVLALLPARMKAMQQWFR